MKNNPLYVTRPFCAPPEEFAEEYRRMSEAARFTNHGNCHERLERELAGYLGVPYFSLVNNATTGLMIACKALNLRGEVIVSPFTFPATVNALTWCGLTPVFADIAEKSFNLDPRRAEEAVTTRTSAILPVHLYGNVCDTRAFDEIARRRKLRLLYDAAHAFGVTRGDLPVGRYGDISVFSFHATKLFHTGEGGGLSCRTADLKNQVDLLRNFGIRDTECVLTAGINGKMSELHAALGLVNLRHIAAERNERARVRRLYEEQLESLRGLTVIKPPSGGREALQYFVVQIDAAYFGMSRDSLCALLETNGVYARKYFYPLCSEQAPYRNLASAAPENLSAAITAAKQLLCLPFYGAMTSTDVDRVCGIISKSCRSRPEMPAHA
ncbi:MAG: DegT/DnrJ/EryC1/StrS family aminotransferase [Candidatus Omnitrophota bacterium]|nr:DegT/DnrJ/EryC1/StrS family aminotransferase [Candidatus Omnitrophota bacterium]